MVEWKKLGEIGSFIRGNGIQKKDFVEDGYGCIHYGQIHTQYGISASETISKIGAALYNKCKKAQKGDVILATTSEDAEGVAKPVVWLGDTDVAVSGDAFIFHHNQDGKYLAYHFLTDRFTQFKIKNATGAKVVRISGESMAKFEVPIPSLSEQQRIVGILDTFTSSIDNLKQQIAQRRKQYDYYRDQLLDLEGKVEIKRYILKDVCEVINGRAYSQPELLRDGKYRVLRVGNFFSNDNWYYSDLELEDKYYCNNGDLLYAWSASFGPHIWEEEKTIYHYHIWKMECSEILMMKYMFYWLQSEDMRKQAFSNLHGATMAHLTKALMESLLVPVPSLPEQQRIVDILDKFEASIQNLEALGGHSESWYNEHKKWEERIK